MTIQVNIDDESLNDLVTKGIKNLPEETVGEIAKEAVKAVFSSPETIKDIVFQKHEGTWDGRFVHSNIRPEILAMLSRAFTDDEVKAYRVELLKALEANKRELMAQVMAEIFIKRLFDDPMEMMSTMSQKLYQLENGRQ